MAEASWKIEQECPQCGGTVVIEESDRVFSCPYCRVRLYITSPGGFRYTLPSKPGLTDELLLIPYWRFKGQIFSCVPYQVKSGILDMTSRAAEIPLVPPSLGIRPQAMKLRFATKETPGSFLKTQVEVESALLDCQHLYNALYQTDSWHQAFIGETVSLVYTPIAIRNSVYDAVLDRRIGSAADLEIDRESMIDRSDRIGVQFVPTLCPHCGWDLDPARDSLAMPCRSCQSVWEAQESGLRRLDFTVQVSDFEPELYLPFWRLEASVEGIELSTYADLVRFGNLPKMVRAEWEERPLNLWTPAFKVHPEAFLRIAKAITLAQPDGPAADRLPEGDLYPITLPPTESAESLKVLIAEFARPKRRLFPRLEEVTVDASAIRLVLVPFEGDAREVRNRELRICLPRNLLRYGRNL